MRKPLPADKKAKYESLCQAWQDKVNDTSVGLENISYYGDIIPERDACLAYQQQLEKEGYQLEYFCNPKIGSKKAQYLKCGDDE